MKKDVIQENLLHQGNTEKVAFYNNLSNLYKEAAENLDKKILILEKRLKTDQDNLSADATEESPEWMGIILNKELIFKAKVDLHDYMMRFERIKEFKEMYEYRVKVHEQTIKHELHQISKNGKDLLKQAKSIIESSNPTIAAGRDTVKNIKDLVYKINEDKFDSDNEKVQTYKALKAEVEAYVAAKRTASTATA